MAVFPLRDQNVAAMAFSVSITPALSISLACGLVPTCGTFKVQCFQQGLNHFDVTNVIDMTPCVCLKDQLHSIRSKIVLLGTRKAQHDHTTSQMLHPQASTISFGEKMS
jgi:hypothetical protein